MVKFTQKLQQTGLLNRAALSTLSSQLTPAPSVAHRNAMLMAAPHQKLAWLSAESERNTGNRTVLQQLANDCLSLSTNAAVPPAVRRAAALQNTLLTGDFLPGPCRNTNLPPALTPRQKDYEAVAVAAVGRHFFACEVGVQFIGHPIGGQIKLVNVGADACLVGTDGHLGKIATAAAQVRSQTFVNLVHTSRSPRLETMLAQGPKTAEQVERLMQASMRYAQRSGCTRVCFVNAATDQVASFSAAVHAAQTDSIVANYLQVDHWPDGTILSPENRRPLVDLVSDIATSILKAPAGHKTLLVVNCHMGLDRSGIVNGLVQLAVDHRNPADPRAATKQVLQNLKEARPRAISASRRYDLFCELHADMLARA
jgi:hypothetical protein